MFTIKNLLILIGRNALISLIVISITILAVFFIEKEIEHITDSIVLNHKLEAELKNRTESFSVVNHDAQIIGGNGTLINNAFVPSNNISEFINALDNLASGNGITETYHFETPISSTLSESFPLSTITYSNNLTTGVLNFSSYLKNFEKLPYFTKIESLNISSQDKIGWAGLDTISLQATLITKTTQ